MTSAAFVADYALDGAANPAAGVRGTAVLALGLREFRNYGELQLRLSGAPVVLTGANGAGKTNILEALSFLCPGRGLRRARLSDVTRHGAGTCWAVNAQVSCAIGPVALGTGLADAQDEGEGSERRVVRINGETAASANGLSEYLDLVWLTPRWIACLSTGFRPGAGSWTGWFTAWITAMHGRYPPMSGRCANATAC